MLQKKLQYNNLTANMGQGASIAYKRIGKIAETVAKKAAENKAVPPPPPPPPPQTTSLGTTITPKNPGGFFRGDGLASQDIRDVGQEMYLKSRQKDAPQEMPDDLLKFIQDVGPVKQSIDKDMTSTRLLEKENVKELEKRESARNSPRKRIDMPLMGEDHDFSVSRNTNFTSGTDAVEKTFGISNLQFYDLLRQKSSEATGEDSVVDSFYQKLVSEDDKWGEEETKMHKKKLMEALSAVQIPVLRIDTDGNIFGLHPDRVPGSEVTSLQPISPSKAKLVLEDVLHRPEIKIERRRPERK
jgi:hypothetical protein